MVNRILIKSVFCTHRALELARFSGLQLVHIDGIFPVIKETFAGTRIHKDIAATDITMKELALDKCIFVRCYRVSVVVQSS
jgi:hypothetical protein